MCDACLNALTAKHIRKECTEYNATRMDLNIEGSLKEEHTMKIIDFLTIINIIKKNCDFPL